MESKSTADFDSFPGLMKLFKWKTECLLCPGPNKQPCPTSRVASDRRSWSLLFRQDADRVPRYRAHVHVPPSELRELRPSNICPQTRRHLKPNTKHKIISLNRIRGGFILSEGVHKCSLTITKRRSVSGAKYTFSNKTIMNAHKFSLSETRDNENGWMEAAIIGIPITYITDRIVTEFLHIKCIIPPIYQLFLESQATEPVC